VAADSPLEKLDISECNLGDAGVRPLFEAVSHSMTLRSLDFCYNRISTNCAREHILPAVRANTSLRELFCQTWDGIVELEEAEALVAARR